MRYPIVLYVRNKVIKTDEIQIFSKQITFYDKTIQKTEPHFSEKCGSVFCFLVANGYIKFQDIIQLFGYRFFQEYFYQLFHLTWHYHFRQTLRI